MRPTRLRRRIAAAGTIGVTALIATLGLGASVAGAVPADPPGGSTPVYPSFNNGVVDGIRDTGSDTTFYMMQQIGDLYTGAGLYGCTLNSGGGHAVQLQHRQHRWQPRHSRVVLPGQRQRVHHGYR